jgi:hypothetical protein
MIGDAFDKQAMQVYKILGVGWILIVGLFAFLIFKPKGTTT